jgi:uncharacterized membrane protein YfcA
MDVMYTVAGFLVGMLVGMTGVGGGALMTPVLVLAFGMAPVVAVGTDLWFAALTKIAGGLVHNRLGGVDWQVFRRLCLGSLPTAVLTLLWIHSSGINQVRQGYIMSALGIVLLLTAVAILYRRKMHEFGAYMRDEMPVGFKQAQPALTVIAGSVLGFLVTLTSIGAGALGVVFLVFLYPRRLTAGRLVGTDIIHAIPLTIVAGTGHLWMGNVDFSLLGQLLLGSVPGIIAGSVLSPRVPDRVLRTAIAIVLIAVGLKIVFLT